MSMYAMLTFRKGGTRNTDAPAEMDPEGNQVFGNNLPKAWDELGKAAEELGVRTPESFLWEDPAEVEDILDELPESAAAPLRKRMASQAEWHPLSDGLATFRALLERYADHPKAGKRAKAAKSVAWDLLAFVRVLEHAKAKGERQFRVEIY